jgi:hypothetical protein
MGARWTEQEHIYMCDYVNENYLSFEKTVEWNTVSAKMTIFGYDRTSESCRKKYRQLEKESNKESEEIDKKTDEVLSSYISFLPSMREEDWQINVSPINESSQLKDNPYLIKELPKVKKSEIKQSHCICGEDASCHHRLPNRKCSRDENSYVEENTMAIRLVVMSLVLIIIIGCAKYFLGG